MTGAGWLSKLSCKRKESLCNQQALILSLVTCNSTTLQCIVAHSAVLLQVQILLPACFAFATKTASLFPTACTLADSGTLLSNSVTHFPDFDHELTNGTVPAWDAGLQNATMYSNAYACTQTFCDAAVSCEFLLTL